MSKANRKIEWSDIDGALPKPKRLHLEKDDADSLYHCPIQLCEHEGFQSQRGCRKHINNKHSWFFYFDEKPHVDLKLAPKLFQSANEIVRLKYRWWFIVYALKTRRKIEAFLLTFSQIGEQFTTWLTGSDGGYKRDRPAQQIVRRCLKFLKFCCKEEEELSFDVMDFSLCSPSLLFKFIECLQEECKLGHGRRLGYIDAMSELIDFRKINGASDGVLRKRCCTLKEHARHWPR